MSVAAEPPHSGLTWETFIELPDKLLLPGFEIGVADLMPQVS